MVQFWEPSLREVGFRITEDVNFVKKQGIEGGQVPAKKWIEKRKLNAGIFLGYFMAEKPLNHRSRA